VWVHLQWCAQACKTTHTTRASCIENSSGQIASKNDG
jgi:hypothetical protein